MIIGSTIVIIFVATAIGTFARYVAQKIGWPDWASFFVGVFITLVLALATPLVITIR